jgi:hypothetical protein
MVVQIVRSMPWLPVCPAGVLLSPVGGKTSHEDGQKCRHWVDRPPSELLCFDSPTKPAAVEMVYSPNGVLKYTSMEVSLQVLQYYKSGEQWAKLWSLMVSTLILHSHRQANHSLVLCPPRLIQSWGQCCTVWHSGTHNKHDDSNNS